MDGMDGTRLVCMETEGDRTSGVLEEQGRRRQYEEVRLLEDRRS